MTRWRPARRRAVPLVAAIVSLWMAAGCGAKSGSADATALRMGVASSFRHAALALAPLAADAGVDLEISPAPTPALVAQIRDGAGLDVVVFADDRYVDELRADGLVEPFGPTVATRMVIAVPAGNPSGVEGAADLAEPSRDVGLCDPRVPCGSYAVEWLGETSLSVDTYEPSSGSLVGRLAAGDLDVAVTYAAEVVASSGAIEEVSTPDTPGPTATTAFGVAVGSARTEAIDRLADVLGSDAARRILRESGYEPVS